MSLRIAYIAFSRKANRYRNDPSFIYRCENMGKALSKLDHSVSYLHISELKRPRDFDVIVFHRPLDSWLLRFVLKKCQWAGTLAVAEYDDLVFNPAYSALSPGVVNGVLAEDKILKRFQLHHKALQRFRFATISTEPLLREIEAINPKLQTQLVGNAVHTDWLSEPEVLQSQLIERVRNPVITYLPGTQSHDKDFATIAEGLIAFLAEHPSVKLEITGPLKLPEAFEAIEWGKQILHREKVSFEEYLAISRNGWVNLAPLEESLFTACKSALKVIEAGFWSKPTLCAASEDNKRFSQSGALLYSSPEAVFDNLAAQLDIDTYLNNTECLRSRILEMAHPEVKAKSCLQFWSDARESL